MTCKECSTQVAISWQTLWCTQWTGCLATLIWVLLAWSMFWQTISVTSFVSRWGCRIQWKMSTDQVTTQGLTDTNDNFKVISFSECLSSFLTEETCAKLRSSYTLKNYSKLFNFFVFTYGFHEIFIDKKSVEIEYRYFFNHFLLNCQWSLKKIKPVNAKYTMIIFSETF